MAGLHASARSFYSFTLGRHAAFARGGMREFYRTVLEQGHWHSGANIIVICDVCFTRRQGSCNADCVRHIQLCHADKQIERTMGWWY